MKIKMLKTACGEKGNFFEGVQYPNEGQNIDEKTATSFIKAGAAVEVDKDGNPVETKKPAKAGK